MPARYSFYSIYYNFILNPLICITLKVGIPGLLHVLGSKPLRLEYLLRIRTPQPDISLSRGDRDGLVSFYFIF